MDIDFLLNPKTPSTGGSSPVAPCRGAAAMPSTGTGDWNSSGPVDTMQDPSIAHLLPAFELQARPGVRPARPQRPRAPYRVTPYAVSRCGAHERFQVRMRREPAEQMPTYAAAQYLVPVVGSVERADSLHDGLSAQGFAAHQIWLLTMSNLSTVRAGLERCTEALLSMDYTHADIVHMCLQPASDGFVLRLIVDGPALHHAGFEPQLLVQMARSSQATLRLMMLTAECQTLIRPLTFTEAQRVAHAVMINPIDAQLVRQAFVTCYV